MFIRAGKNVCYWNYDCERMLEKWSDPNQYFHWVLALQQSHLCAPLFCVKKGSIEVVKLNTFWLIKD